MEWIVKISGDGFDLKELANALPSGDFSITQDGDDFVLKSPLLEQIGDPEVARDKAKEILESINGIARLKLGSQEPVKIAHLQRTGDDGKSKFFVHLSGNMPAPRGTLGIPQPLFGPVELAQNDQNVAKVLRLIGIQGSTWVNLYRILEIISEDVGAEPKIKENGWATRASLRRFKSSSNHPHASGDEARHGASKESPPPKPMSLSEANSPINSVVSKWLSWKEDNQRPSR